MELKTYFAQDGNGNVIPAARAYLYLAGSPTLALGLQDAAGNALPNPFAANDNGMLQLAAPNGDYDLRVTGAGRDYRMPVRFVGVLGEYPEYPADLPISVAQHVALDAITATHEADVAAISATHQADIAALAATHHDDIDDITSAMEVSVLNFIPKSLRAAVMNGTSNYDASGALALAFASGAKFITLSGGTIFLASPVVVPPSVDCLKDGGINTIGGRGALDIGLMAGSPVNQRNTRIINITFEGGTATTGTGTIGNGDYEPGNYAIRYANALFAGLVSGCTFRNYDVCIWQPNVKRTTGLPALGQNSTRLTVTECHCNIVNYFALGDRQTQDKVGWGDLTISDCHGYVLRSHGRWHGIDGLIFADNTCFNTGWYGRSQNKDHGLYIDGGMFINIHGNQIFECGLEGILIERTDRYLVYGNYITWPGQRAERSGIKIDKGAYSFSPAGEKVYNSGSGLIYGNIIDAPTKYGIEIAASTALTETGANTGDVTIFGNLVTVPGATTFYYGDGSYLGPSGEVTGPNAVPALQNPSHFDVYADANTTHVRMLDNPSRTGISQNNSSPITTASFAGNVATGRRFNLLNGGTQVSLAGGVTRLEAVGAVSASLNRDSFLGYKDGDWFTIANMGTGNITLTHLNATSGPSLILKNGGPTLVIGPKQTATFDCIVSAAGGTTGQALLKQSNGDYDADWQSIGDLNVVVEVIEETQELAADQTVVILSLTTTNSLAIYVEGVRLRPDEWTPDPLAATRLTLGQSYPEGTRIVATQNEPNGNVGAPLMQALNLFDVPDKGAARANLDVFSRAEARQMSPAGQVAYFARSAAPTGWLKANGAAVSRAAYADLFAAIGTTFGGGDGFNTFNLPDLRGEFIRGWDDARGVDIGRAFASWQGSQNISHQHGGTSDAAGDHIHAGNTANGGSHIHAAATAGAGGHTHDGGTGGAGGHAHGASASDVGNHQHALASGPLSSGNTTLTIGGTLAVEKTSEGDSGYRLINNNSLTTPTLGLSSASGAHSHAITIAGVGDHTHGVYINGVGDHAHGVTIAASGDHAHSFNTSTAGQHVHSFTTAASGGNEARPRNIALLACIKY